MSNETSIKSFGKALSKEEKKELAPIEFEFYGTVFKAKPLVSGFKLMKAQQEMASVEGNQATFALANIAINYISDGLINEKESKRFLDFVAETEEVDQEDIYGLYTWLVGEQANRPTSK